MPEQLVPLRRNRDFVLLWTGLAVSALGTRVASIAYPLLVLALTGSAGQAGLVGFAATLPYLVVQLPAGALVDRWDRRRVMIWCDVGRGLAVTTVVVAVVADHVSLAHLVVVAFVEGTLFVFFNLAEVGAVRAIVPRAQIPAALSQTEARVRGAGLAGQPLGGLLYDLGRAVPFLVDVLTYLVSLVTLLSIRSPLQEARERAPTGIGAEIKEGLTWLWRQPFLRATALLVAGSNFLFQALVLVLIVIAREQGASAALIGLMLAGAGAGGVLGSLSASWLQRRLPAKAVVIGANWVWALFVPLLAVAPNPYVLGALFAAMAFVGPAWNVVIGAYALSITPDRLLGRVQSAETLVAYGAIPLGSLAAGVLLEWVGPVAAVLALSAWMLAIAVAATLSRSIREAPSLEDARAAAGA